MVKYLTLRCYSATRLTSESNTELKTAASGQNIGEYRMLLVYTKEGIAIDNITSDRALLLKHQSN
jgi:hypothetical protein